MTDSTQNLGLVPQESDILIIGGGLAGMCAAYESVKNGLRPVVIETRSRPGGLIAAAELAGTRFDIGAESWATRSTVVNELIAELELPITYPTGRSWVWNQQTGACYPIPEGILGLPSNIEAPEVKIAIGEAGVARARADYHMGTEGLEHATFGGLVRARLGDAVAEHLIKPIAGGIHTSDPDSLAVDAVSPGLHAEALRQESLLRAATAITAKNPGAKIAQTTGGMFRLIEALAEKIVAGGGKILTKHAVTSLTPGWQVTVQETQRGANPAAEPIPTGDVKLFRAPRIVLAVPGPVALELLHQAIGVKKWQLPEGAPIAHQVLLLNAGELDSGPRGSGILISEPKTAINPETALQTKAISHLSYKWGWMREALPPAHHLLRVSYGRPGVPYPEPTVEAALRDVNTVFGTSLKLDQVVGEMLVRWDGQLAPATLEHRQKIQKLLEEVQKYSGLKITGAWVSGSGFAAVVPHAREAVRKLIQFL